MSTERIYVVDRFEGGTAVLDDDEGGSVNIARDRLPDAAKEGDVLRVPPGPDGSPNWALTRVDVAETERRHSDAARLLDELGRRDPGGDVTL